MSRLLNYSPDRYSRISETRQSVLISSGPIGPKWHLYQKTSQLWHVCGTNPEFEDIDEGTKVPIYQRLYQERATGIEPALPAWEAGVLPLNYARALSTISKNSYKPLARSSQRGTYFYSHVYSLANLRKTPQTVSTRGKGSC